MLLTRSPLIHLSSFRRNHLSFIVRLACVMHAASVYPEPGSNSQFKFDLDYSSFFVWSQSINFVVFYFVFLKVHASFVMTI